MGTRQTKVAALGLVALCIAVLLLRETCFGQSPTETILYSFTGGLDGAFPAARLVFDPEGNLYGTTLQGGSGTACSNGCGTIFRLSPSGSGWTKTVLYNFMGGADGLNPSSQLVFDNNGNLYGTTDYGGNGVCNPLLIGCGTVFELSPTSAGWTETVLYAFAGGTDGAFPYGVILDLHDNLYGVTRAGGKLSHPISVCTSARCGTVFKLAHTTNGWKKTQVYYFAGTPDGSFPVGNLIFDSRGNLYGTTVAGGAVCGSSGRYVTTCGTVFKLTHSVNGWKETQLYTFRGSPDGQGPVGDLIFDQAGNLYGATNWGGNRKLFCLPGCGTAFVLKRSSSGWTETVLHNFAGGTDGLLPEGGLRFDSAGSLYGATEQGGTGSDGTVYKLTNNSGHWTESVLHNFTGGTDGYLLTAGVVIDAAGNVYGTAEEGGGNPCNGGPVDCGVVFEITQ